MQSIDESDIESVCRVLTSSHLTQGELTQHFETTLSASCGVKHAISFNSATSALYALYGAFLHKHFPNHITHPKDDEICFITTPISFVATTNMMIKWNIWPIFCDIKPDGNIDELALEKLLETHPKKDKIRAVVSVDYGGKSVEFDTLSALAKQYNIPLFSDSSHSFGGSYKSHPIGSLADATIFSFHALKPITTAEGGAILTNDDELMKYSRLLLSHGVEKNALWDYDCVLTGMNFRLSELGAGLGLSQLKKLEPFITHRKQIASLYDELFTHNPYFDTIPIPPYIQSSHHLYPILLRPELHKYKKQIFQNLQDQGLGVQVHYKPIYQFSFYRNFYPTLTLDTADNFYDSEISIPCHQNLTLAQAQNIAHIILNCMKTL